MTLRREVLEHFVDQLRLMVARDDKHFTYEEREHILEAFDVMEGELAPGCTGTPHLNLEKAQEWRDWVVGADAPPEVMEPILPPQGRMCPFPGAPFLFFTPGRNHCFDQEGDAREFRQGLVAEKTIFTFYRRMADDV